nr:hypothetical protein [Kordiimonas gwangyangensis]
MRPTPVFILILVQLVAVLVPNLNFAKVQGTDAFFNLCPVTHNQPEDFTRLNVLGGLSLIASILSA